MPGDREKMMTPQEVADWLQIHLHTIYNWIDSGKLKAYKVGRVYRIPEAEVWKVLEPTAGGEAESGGEDDG